MGLELGGNVSLVITLIACAIGCLSGSLIRDISIIKGIIAFFVLPTSIRMLIDINDVIGATLPYLLFAWLGYLGWKKSQFYAMELLDFTRGMGKGQ